MNEDIPQKWIMRYVDELIEAAKMFGPGSPMSNAAAMRADHIMDMVQAFRKRAEAEQKGGEG